ncbi:MAG TPA: methyltransferase domain-containing protein [Longimicrobiaceae bacterium]|nr:methyltransferase domain-containing protein [Longimicrobiaceae bacterium]
MPLRNALLLVTLFLAVGTPARAQSAHPPLYIPTPMPLVEAMLAMGGLRPGDVVYDLGSGDGRIVIEAALRGARAVGVEFEAALVDRSWVLAESAGVRDRVDFRHHDLFETDLREATLVTVYLGHAFNLRLRPQLLEQLRPGSRVVSHAFHMGDWEPDSMVAIGTGGDRATLYSWIVPADVDGFWFLDIEGVTGLTMEVNQRFQRIPGTVRRGDRTFELLDGQVEGERIRFRLVDGVEGAGDPLLFTGRLEEGGLIGSVRGPPGWGVRRWTAVRFSADALSPEDPGQGRSTP